MDIPYSSHRRFEKEISNKLDSCSTAARQIVKISRKRRGRKYHPFLRSSADVYTVAVSAVLHFQQSGGQELMKTNVSKYGFTCFGKV